MIEARGDCEDAKVEGWKAKVVDREDLHYSNLVRNELLNIVFIHGVIVEVDKEGAAGFLEIEALGLMIM